MEYAKTIVTKKELATRLKLTPRSVENLMLRGLPHLKLSKRCTRFKLEDVDAWLNQKCGVACN